MNDARLMAEILQFGVSALILWAMWIWLISDSLVDRLRQNLFGLRDRLFDEARAGLVPFDHRGYTMMRVMINGFIRFGHRVTILEMVMIGLLNARSTAPCDACSFDHEWEAALRTLDKEAAEKLRAYRGELMRMVGRHLLCISPLFTLLVWVPVVLVVLAVGIFLNAKGRLKRFKARLIDGIEIGALTYGGGGEAAFAPRR